MDNSEKRLVTIKEAAFMMSVSERTIYRLIEAGKLAILRITADTPRIRWSAISRLLNGVAPTRPPNEPVIRSS